MAKIIKDDMLDEILSSGPKQYFFQREEDGEVTITFTSSVSITEPGEEDIVGRIWNPPVVDANGNPILDRNGNQREPWAKVEAECIINGAPRIYSFGGKSSPLLRAWTTALKANSISNLTLPGTKWQASKTGRWNWNIKFLGTENLPSSVPTNDEKIKDLKQILTELKTKNPMVSKGVDKKQLVKTLALLSGKSQSDIEDVWSILKDQKVIDEKDGKSFVL